MKKLLAFTFIALSGSLGLLKAQSGVINTVAGDNGAGYNGDNIQATVADLSQDNGVCVDAGGNFYIADSRNNRIRKVNTSGIITTIAGNGVAGYTGDGGLATIAEIDYPACVRVDPTGNVYFSDNGNGVIRKITSGGRISTIAGNGFGGYSGDGGPATAAEFGDPTGIGLDANLNVYVADQTNNAIRKIATTGIITTVAGKGPTFAGYTGNGGAATGADLNQPSGVAIDPSGNMYISEFNNNVVRVVSTVGIINLFAGVGPTFGGFNGVGGQADTTELSNPTGVSTDAVGNVYIADAGNSMIREVLVATNQMYVIAGNGDYAFSGDGGVAYNAELDYPFDVIPDNNNHVFIADLNNNRVRKITMGCVAGGTATAVSYNYPECNGGTDGIIVAFAVSPFEPYSYSWSNGFTSSEDTAVAAGVYTVTITDAFGCTGTGSVTITQPPAIVVNTTDSNAACLNSQVLLSSTASGGVGALTYEWVTGDPTDTLTVQATSNAAYTIYVFDASGCVDSAIANVFVNPLPNAILNAQNYNVCDDDTSDTLMGSPLGGTYSGPFLTGNVFNPSLAGAGVDTFYYAYTDSAGCSTVAMQTVNVNVCTGIKGLANSSKITVYPNPATDQFSIQFASGEAAQLVELYSITGQMVYQNKYVSSKNSLLTINTQQFTTGVYILKVLLQDGSTLVQKVDVVK